ncbi:hypothetical protein [Haloparvum sedimenti]|uniref:hypothetical protein n=1 Tax=Haloparvum sedimenti TaxID=1678448 RepID=UPI00071E8023|nr:hypothetical protein [Haloparvum sedimenti]
MSESDGGDREDAAGEGAGSEDREDPAGFEDAVASSSGSPLVLLGLNAVLSATFAWIAVWGMGLLGLVAYTPVNVATAAIVLFALTYVLVLQ